MKIDYDKIQTAVKNLGAISDNDTFLEKFLSAFNFPQATYARLKAKARNAVNLGLRIQGNGGVYFLATTAASLNSEFNILKKNNNLSKIKEAFIIIVNETEVLAYERESADVLQSSKKELYRSIEFFFPLLGVKSETASEEMKSADKKAAEKFAELYNELRMRNEDCSADIAEMLCRLLFCLFADNIGVLTSGGLRPLILRYTDASGSDTSAFFCNLFEAIKQSSRDGLPGYFSNVKHIDSRLFADDLLLLDFSKKARSLVLDLMAVDWSDVSPDILGSLIQSIIREKPKNSNGNYTSTANIQKVIGPLFMNGLFQAFERAQTSRESCEALLQRITTLSVFDPASGTGNFLLVAYKELNKLAEKIRDALADHEKIVHLGSPSLLQKTKSPHGNEPLIPWSNFYGIDEDIFSCTIARLGFLFVVCQQAKADTNTDISRVFTATIDVLFSDNIIAGNATKIDWETVCQGNGETYLVGNPSYTGSRKQTPAQKSDLKRVFAGYNKISELDYATCWFLLATNYICAHGGGFAFVTTNSLTQGLQVQLLWPKLFEKGVHIKFAHTSFKWKNDARNRTAVTVVIIGVVPNTNTQPRELFSSTTVTEPRSISPYLTPGEVIVRRRRSSPLSNLPKMVKGNMPLWWSDYLLKHEEMTKLVASEPRIKKFLRKVVGSKEFIHGIERWCFWIPDEDVAEAQSIPCIADRIECVRQKRLASSDASARSHADHPHRFRENRETTTSSLVVPSVSSENREYIPIGFIDKSIIVTNLAFVIYDCEPWIFGVIASRMHNVWARTVCGALETRPRYSSELGYNTFPFPDICTEQKAEITQRVFAIIAAREQYPGKSYAEWYAPHKMPSELRHAHYLLDLVIERYYRDTPFVSDQERLDCLFELYHTLNG